MYKRHIDEQLKSHFLKYKQAIILLGARQTGKTTLLKKIFPRAQYLLVDNQEVKNALETYDLSTYKQILNLNSNQVIIDELHLLSDPGRVVKIIYDQIPDIQLIVTGSSALHIKNKSTESMAGRKIEYKLYPLSFSEYLQQIGVESDLNYNILELVTGLKNSTAKLFSADKILDRILAYGLYPEVMNIEEPREYLLELADSAIYKDILELDLIDNRSKASQLLRLLSYQIGNLINYSEIGQKLSMDRRTVERYIEIFEQSYLIYRLYPFSQNKRDEIGKAPKVYFYDLGLRNAIIKNFDISPERVDLGAMFENFIVSEVKKIIEYTKSDYNLNYWRLARGSEVDMVLSNSLQTIGVEIKLNSGSVSEAFINRYPSAKTYTLTRSNFY
jgi:predicted AAA+ superfamily ATPase